MEFEGVVYKIMPPVKGTSARGEWQRQEVIFDLPSEFSRKVCVIFFNKESEVARLREGATYTVSFNLESREYNGRWYTDVRAWRVQSKDEQQAAAAPSYGAAGQNYGGSSYSAPATASAPATDLPPLGGEEPSYTGGSAAQEVDDLPF